MSERFDCGDTGGLLAGLRLARRALAAGDLVVLPTDTVYGVAADAFTPSAVAALLRAKGRGRRQPPPVLFADLNTLGALAAEVGEALSVLAEAFWPGPLTVVTAANPSLSWDLGESAGTVALRIPRFPLVLELLRDTGPLAVSSANVTGRPAAVSVREAQAMLGDSVAVYLDAGELGDVAAPDSDLRGPGLRGAALRRASTIVDLTGVWADGAGGNARVLREGPITVERLRAVLPGVSWSVSGFSGKG